ncbi:hypothetical protein MPSEU_000562800 [Mayamaea pseudoterrestris]|nr:hypothetical protein MPSEU_000562800 [Mayamaea pseudoterrestris]
MMTTNVNSRSVQFVVGNTYKRLPLSKAKLDRSGKYHKTHDWTLFVDVLQGDPDVIERVSFDLGAMFATSVFICSCPVQLERPGGRFVWRFSTRQQTHGMVNQPRIITIRGRGGSAMKVDFVIDARTSQVESQVMTFTEHRPPRPLKFIKISEQLQFGVELELTAPVHISPSYLANELSQSTHLNVDAIDSYGHGRATSTNWKIVPDSSIMCGPSLPDCNTLELVSPILCGGEGLSQINALLRSILNIRPGLKVNKSMGFHVHVDVSSLSHEQLVKVCQNFVKYEAAMDSLMPASRRTGSPQCDEFFASNRRSVSRNNLLTNRQCLTGLAACADLHSLIDMMNNGGSRYYKLNLQNLRTGRQPTIEFRQHSGTMNYAKVSAWVRFCLAFVTNSAKLRAPKAFKSSRSLDDQLEALFQFVIKDRALRNYYRGRRDVLARHEDDEDGACCSGCAAGGACASSKRNYEFMGFHLDDTTL